AVEVVRAEGIHELTTRAIARRSGLTPPAIYRHFSSKQDLVREVLGEVRERLHDRFLVETEGSPVVRLLRTLEVFRDFAIEEPRLYDALFLQTADAAVLPSAPAGRGGNILAVLVERVTECGREGTLRSDGPVGTA